MNAAIGVATVLKAIVSDERKNENERKNDNEAHHKLYAEDVTALLNLLWGFGMVILYNTPNYFVFSKFCLC